MHLFFTHSHKFCLLVVAVTLPLLASPSAFADTDAALLAKVERLEQRLAEMEARFSCAEEKTKEHKVSAANSAGSGTLRGASLDILAGSASRNLRWTQEEQWQGIEKGVSRQAVVEQLGYPPRSVKSLKPRVDLVYYYETSLRDSTNSTRGKISFKDGVVIAVSRPDFGKFSAAP